MYAVRSRRPGLGDIFSGDAPYPPGGIDLFGAHTNVPLPPAPAAPLPPANWASPAALAAQDPGQIIDDIISRTAGETNSQLQRFFDTTASQAAQDWAANTDPRKQVADAAKSAAPILAGLGIGTILLLVGGGALALKIALK